MHLIDDEDAVFATLRGRLHLVGDVADVVDTIVGGGVEFNDIHGGASVDGFAIIAFATCLAVGGRVKAIDCLGEDSGAGSFADAAGPTEEVGLSESVGRDGVFQRGSQVFLTHDASESSRSILARTNYIIIHTAK